MADSSEPRSLQPLHRVGKPMTRLSALANRLIDGFDPAIWGFAQLADLADEEQRAMGVFPAATRA